MAAELQQIEATNRSIEELEEEIRAENDRRYAFYRMLNATDRVLWRLEELNRDGVQTLPPSAYGRIRRTLRELPDSCVQALVDSDYVQDVLDSVFDVQERLLRWRDPQRDVDSDEVPEVDYTTADLVRWGDLCRALDQQSSGVPKGKVSVEDTAQLECMREHQLVYMRDQVYWRARSNWPVTLERLRAALAAGEGE